MDDILAPTWHKRSIGAELMNFQSRDFAIKLVDQIKILYKEASTPARAEQHPARAEIEKLILDNTGVKVVLTLQTNYPPCCLPVMGNSNHVLSSLQVKEAYLEQELDFIKAVKKDKKAIGTFDPRTGKLGGVYSKLDSPIYMSWGYCQPNFSEEEFAAVLMHEVGHCSLAFQFMFRTYRASQLLAALHQVRTGRDNSITYEKAISIVGEELCDNAREFESVVAMKDDRAIATIVYSRSWAKLGNDFGDNSVTGPNFEALSDNYAARWGFAEPLATALYSLYGDGSFGARNRTSATVAYIAGTLIPLVIGGAYGFMMAGPGGALMGISLLAVLAVAAGGRGDSSFNFHQANVYDTPIVRMERIRESIIEQLKTFELKEEMRQTLLKELKTINSMVEDRIQTTTLFNQVALIFPSNWKASAAFDLERSIERLTQNDLFAAGQSLLAKR